MASIKLLLLSIFTFLFMPARGMCRQLVMFEQEPEKPAELIFRLAYCIPSKCRSEQIAWFEKISREEIKQPPSLKHQAACKLLARSFGKAIETLPLPPELKEELRELESEMNNYYEDVKTCVKQGFGGKYRSIDIQCAIDILEHKCGIEKHTCTQFLNTLKNFAPVEKNFFKLDVYGYLLRTAVYHGNYNMAQWLLQNGTQPNGKGEYRGHEYERWHSSDTALNLAISRDQKKMVELLLRYGADVSSDSNGKNPLLLACKNNESEDITQMLINHGISYNVTDQDKYTPLHIVAQRENHKIAKVLLEHGHPINIVGGYQNKTPLLCAFGYWGWPPLEIIRLFVSHKADINIGDNYKTTPLMYAAEARCLKTLELLIKNGAHINAQDSQGRTPLIHALQTSRENHAIIKKLIESNANINIKDDQNKTALDYAIDNYSNHSEYNEKERRETIQILEAQKPASKFSRTLRLFYYFNKTKILITGMSAGLAGLGFASWYWFKKYL